MDGIGASQLRSYPTASLIEWIEADGAGGGSASSVLNANTRKQHGMLSIPDDQGGRTVLVSSLQESIIDGTRTYDLSTNAYFGAIHPSAYLALESFTTAPWPTWRYAFDTLAVEKQLVVVRGEHTVIVIYTLTRAERPAVLVVRPLLAFRDHNAVRREAAEFPGNWQISHEFIECRPFKGGGTLYIAHPDARIETVGLWYRGFLYERDRESRLDCIEDLFHPGSIEISLMPNTPQALVFSTPSPRSLKQVDDYLVAERERRQAIIQAPDVPDDPLFSVFLRSADTLLYEQLDGWPAIFPGLPWGESRVFRGLLAFSGLLLTRGRFDVAQQYLVGLAHRWRQNPSLTQFEPETVVGQMHPVDVPLWLFVAAWRYWKAAEDTTFLDEVLYPLLEEMATHYLEGDGVRCTDEGLIEVGYEPGADYAPVLPLGTNVLWYNAQRLLAEIIQHRSTAKANVWRDRAQCMLSAFTQRFACAGRSGLADAVRLTPAWQDETLRPSQVLAVGLPYCVTTDPRPIVSLITEHLATPFGLRTLSPMDSRYVGNGEDVRLLPKHWSGSVDATWFGCYCDALQRCGVPVSDRSLFVPFEGELHRRGYGHISGAFTGDAPHEPCDYVASASAVGEVMRIYAREILQVKHVV